MRISREMPFPLIKLHSIPKKVTMQSNNSLELTCQQLKTEHIKLFFGRCPLGDNDHFMLTSIKANFQKIAEKVLS